MPRRLRKLLWLASALATLAAVRACLTLIGYRRLTALAPAKTDRPPPPFEVQARCAWALTRAARYVPGATCLTQALAGRWMLDRRGFGTTIVVGVRPGEDAALLAHAWLKAGEEVIVGGDAEDLSRFSRVTELGATL